MVLCNLDERLCKRVKMRDPLRGRVRQIQPKVEGHLVVARPTRVQLSGDITHELAKPTLDCGVNIFVGFLEGELPGSRLREDLIQAGLKLVGFVGGDDAGLGKHHHMGDRAPHVDFEQTPIGIVDRIRPGPLADRALEPTAPEGHCPVP